MAILTTIMYIIAVIAAIWVIYDVLANQKKMETTHKVIWIVCGVLFSIITAIVYYFMVKNK